MTSRKNGDPPGLRERPSPKFRSVNLVASSYDPLSAFLLDTLVVGTKLHQRNGISYLTLRRWRTSVKPYQISALRVLKQNPPVLLINTIAEEVAAALDTTLGVRACSFVVPMPCSRSRAETCLSLLISEKVASKLRLPTIRALSLDPANGSSHPITATTRPPMRLVEPLSGSALLVDDVATSGAHIEEASKLLRPSAGTVLSIAWIGGNEG